ncbi:RodZ domain-containing protein [Neptuniibacter halophilus]|uniref:RodZ domain-containing protein n=1 Tax=Neptuniibacter halophilus TaxID=651666 RepID=UPI002572CE34|nr:RodZ family helix-turn-helix domain-containing protein [Neptuniibacter halophilus]
MSTEEQECQPELLAEEWGARLTTARESLSISIEQASADLNLPVDYLRKLERGELKGLPSMVFARGYIRSYAKLLHLNDSELVCEYERIHGETGKGQIRPVSRVRQQVRMGDPVMKLFSWIFFLAIIGVSVWWWQTQYGGDLSLGDAEQSAPEGADQPSQTTAPGVVEMEDGSAQLVLPKLDDTPADSAPAEAGAEKPESAEEPEYLSDDEIQKLQQAIDSNAGSDSAAAVEETAAAQDIAPAATEQAASPSVADGEVSVTADFIAECWVSIKDANGKTLFNNLRGKGQSLSVTGQGPLNVLIGAADAVGRFSYNGSELDLSEHSRKNIVRISLPIAE